MVIHYGSETVSTLEYYSGDMCNSNSNRENKKVGPIYPSTICVLGVLTTLEHV